ncbi:MAG: hypothetical protein ACKN89_03935 [Cyanobium sp.]
MNIGENEFRDLLFSDHREKFSKLIIGKRDSVVWSGDGFPPISFLLQQEAEKKINEILDDIEDIVLIGKEVPLKKSGETTTRVDLLGESESAGLSIIELKKSKQTERQAFTELLAYSNHFCSIFPGLQEATLTSILVAPMQTRTVRDAYVQELVVNNKNIIALVPSFENEVIKLSVYYPDKKYYQWYENNLFDDRSMSTVAISFPVVDGWIDTDIKGRDKGIPDYSKSALNTISNSISHKLDSLGIHALVYASQKWGEIGQIFPFPNTIFVVATNPFSSFRASVDGDSVYGDTDPGRIEEIQSIYDNLHEDEKEFWLDRMESDFHGRLIRIVKEEFRLCFLNDKGKRIDTEISLPDWYGVKTSMIDSVFTHNLDVYLTGLFRSIYMSYVTYAYRSGEDPIYYGDGLPGYSYKMLREFLPVWEIIRGIGFGDDSA